MAQRKGIMIYFDLLEMLTEFTDQEIGQLFRSMLEYAINGTIPDFSDRAMRAIWITIQQKIDRDDERYQTTVEARKYAAYCREYRKENGDSKPLTLEEWKHQMISNDVFDIQLQQQLQPQLQQQLQPQLQQQLQPQLQQHLQRDYKGEAPSAGTDPLSAAWEEAKQQGNVDEMARINILRQRGF